MYGREYHKDWRYRNIHLINKQERQTAGWSDGLKDRGQHVEKAENGNKEYNESESAMKHIHVCFGSFVLVFCGDLLFFSLH